MPPVIFTTGKAVKIFFEVIFHQKHIQCPHGAAGAPITARTAGSEELCAARLHIIFHTHKFEILRLHWMMFVRIIHSMMHGTQDAPRDAG